MRNDWKNYALSELGVISTGKTPSSKIKDAFGGDIPFITPKDMDGRKWIDSTERFLSTNGVNSIINYLLPSMSVAVSCIGSDMGKAVMLTKPSVTNQQINTIIVDEKKFNPEYIYYCLSTKQSFLKNIASGSATPILNKGHFSNVQINLPKKCVQDKVVNILSCIDKKIDLNNKTNETLEQIAQALFKSWFVDFDPVKAKAEGGDLDAIAQELGMSKEILALFPDEFEESELGLIPKGWKVKPLYETAEYINGSAFKATDFSDNKEGMPIVKIVELKQGITDGTQFTLNEVQSKYFIDNGDVLYSWSGSPETSLDVFKWHSGKGWLNQHIFKLNFDTVQQKYFTYFLLKQIKPLLISTAKQKQTTGLGHITVADMKRIKIVYPSPSVLDKFSEQICPIYEKSSKLIEENHILMSLRDTLLPKLLSGEITIASADKIN